MGRKVEPDPSGSASGSEEIVATLNQKVVIDRMLSEGTVPSPSGPDEFAAYMKLELKK